MEKFTEEEFKKEVLSQMEYDMGRFKTYLVEYFKKGGKVPGNGNFGGVRTFVAALYQDAINSDMNMAAGSNESARRKHEIEVNKLADDIWSARIGMSLK